MSALVGPGRLVLVVGPSGAGKDTIINGARQALAGNAQVVFPRRVVTRPSSTAEDHDSTSTEAFENAAAKGGFALRWDAHGHKYGIPRAIDDDIAAGRTVVCNVSRTVIAPARARYADVAAVLVTAPAEVLAARLGARGREAGSDVTARLKRSDQIGDTGADFAIDNGGAADKAIAAFVAIITPKAPA